MTGLLSWDVQMAGHAAFVEARRVGAPVWSAGLEACHRKRKSPESAERNRAALLHALGDGKPHRFADLRAALPGMSCQGIYYLLDALRAEGRIVFAQLDRRHRKYQLT